MTVKNADARFILEKGILAPSADNLQPWKFRIGRDQIDLFLDPERVRNFCDAGYLAPYASAGALIENIRVASNHLGYRLSTAYFPRAHDPLWVATLRFSLTQPELHPHYSCLERRVTNRKFYKPSRKIGASISSTLKAIAESETGFNLLWLDKSSSYYPKLCHLIGAADQMRFEHERLLREFVGILRFRSSKVERKDGLDFRTLETGLGGYPLFKLMSSWKRVNFLNTFGMSRLFNFYAELQMKSSSAVGFLVASGNKALDYVRGGEVMERIWHEATRLGLSIQPMEALPIFIISLSVTGGSDFTADQKQKLEVLKREFLELFGIDDQNGLILLFRIGYASPPTARSLRRPIEEFLL